MVISGEGFTAGAEISVFTDSALVANPVDIALRGLVLAEGAITEDSIMDFVLTGSFADSIVDLNKTMARVMLGGGQNALGAEVPVRAGQAFVTDANDALRCVSITFRRGIVETYLVTPVTDSSMAELTARKAARCDEVLQAEVTVGAEVEGVTGVVAMLVTKKAAKAQVVVFAIIAADKIALVGFYSLLAKGLIVNDIEELTTTASVTDWLVFALDGCIKAGRWGSWLRDRLLN